MKMSDEMFEGKDYPTQWALNPSTYQNMNSDQVDWAALAQQWIKMKETAVPPAPPPPPIINSLQSSSLNDGGGEAPMDMDTKDDDIPPAPPAPNISGTDGWNQWNEWGNHWNHTSVGNSNWEWSGISEGTDGKPIGMPDTTLIPPPAPTISSNNSTFANHCTASTAIAPVPPSLPPSFGYNPIPLSQPPFNNQIPPGGFWSSDQQQHGSIPGTSIPIQPPFMKGGRHNSSRVPHVSTPANILATTDIVSSRHRDVRDRTPEEELPIVLDTIKRRQLPAWIREGLEKMEREKQKAVERERQELLRKQELEARKKAEDQAREVLNPSKSKFDSDSEKEATEHELDDDNKSNNNSNGEKHIPKEIYEQNSPDIMRPRKSRFHDANSPIAHSHTPATREKSPDNTQVHPKSSSHQNKEEILQNLMLKVRRSLTEILLEVTNDEIGAVCKEVWKRSLSKGKNLVHASPNLAPVAQITRKLGLGIYGDSNSESEEENTSQNEHSQQQNIKEIDSDDELKETLRRRQQAFRKTEAEIEARIALEEEQDDDDDDEDERVKGRQADEQDNTKKNDDAWKEGDDSNAKDKSRVKRDNYMGNTSCLVTGDNDKDSACDNEKKSSDGRRGGRATSSKAGADSDRLGHRLSHEDDSSSSESASRSQSSKRPARRSGSSTKNSRGKKKAAKNRSSSRSRSRSRHKYSSRENSCESSRSRSRGKSTSSGHRLADKKHKSHPPSQKSAGADKQYYKSGSRSSSRSESRLNSESRSRSRSRSRSKQKRSRTRSRSANSHRRRRSSRDRRLRSRSKTRARSHSRSRSHESRSRSRSRKRSRSSYGRKNSAAAGAGRAAGKKRDTRSRSSERTRRSRSKSRSSRGYYRQHSSHYRRDRDGKKSAHRYQD